ncbi:MAG: hypothetical protein K2J79_02210 [Ruminiclostridium sp.]|nr:hypothetical protein [Ruminiclostridium sp.]
MVRKVDVKNFIREHKGEIITAITIIGAIAVECYQNLSNKIEPECDFEDTDCFDFSEEAISNTIDIDEGDSLDKRITNVKQHIRNLPNGRKASPEKIALAEELGIDLGESQTWIEEYQKGGN